MRHINYFNAIKFVTDHYEIAVPTNIVLGHRGNVLLIRHHVNYNTLKYTKTYLNAYG